jgi:hypothetical protein
MPLWQGPTYHMVTGIHLSHGGRDPLIACGRDHLSHGGRDPLITCDRDPIITCDRDPIITWWQGPTYRMVTGTQLSHGDRDPLISWWQGPTYRMWQGPTYHMVAETRLSHGDRDPLITWWQGPTYHMNSHSIQHKITVNFTYVYWIFEDMFLNCVATKKFPGFNPLQISPCMGFHSYILRQVWRLSTNSKCRIPSFYPDILRFGTSNYVC